MAELNRQEIIEHMRNICADRCEMRKDIESIDKAKKVIEQHHKIAGNALNYHY